MSDPKTAEEYAQLRVDKADECGWGPDDYESQFRAEIERAFEAGRMSMALQLLEKRQ